MITRPREMLAQGGTAVHVSLHKTQQSVRVLLATLLLASGLLVWSTAGAVAISLRCGTILNHSCATLTMTLTGDGSGSFVTTDSAARPDGAINCARAGGVTSGTCTHTYDVVNGSFDTIFWTQQTLPGSRNCWVDCGWGSGSMGSNLHLSADATDASHGFQLLTPITVSVVRSGSGAGSVTSGPRGISCGSKCQLDFASGQPVKLTAAAAKGSVFSGWSQGPCSGTVPTCTFTPTATTAVVAVFNKAPKPTPKGTLHANVQPTVGASAAASAASTQVVEAVTAEPGASASPAAAAIPVGGADPAPSGTDLTPIAIAIVVAGLAIAASLAIGLRPRSVKPPPAPPAS